MPDTKLASVPHNETMGTDPESASGSPAVESKVADSYPKLKLRHLLMIAMGGKQEKHGHVGSFC